MCGRYRLSATEHLEEAFEADATEAPQPRYNIAPSQPVQIIRSDKGRRLFVSVRWGLVPFWAKDVSIGHRTINARSETAPQKPAFREAFARRRCLIPADGFYEWKRTGSRKQPFHVGMKDDYLFAFAGLWDAWKGPDGTLLESCTILTTTPNPLLGSIHDRMPVILSRSHYEMWLTAPPSEVPRLTGLLRPFDAELMKCYEVTSLVNSPQNEGPDCIRPMALLNPAQ
jgi:putative SOS response-associated peptidase YedK